VNPTLTKEEKEAEDLGELGVIPTDCEEKFKDNATDVSNCKLRQQQGKDFSNVLTNELKAMQNADADDAFCLSYDGSPPYCYGNVLFKAAMAPRRITAQSFTHLSGLMERFGTLRAEHFPQHLFCVSAMISIVTVLAQFYRLALSGIGTKLMSEFVLERQGGTLAPFPVDHQMLQLGMNGVPLMDFKKVDVKDNPQGGGEGGPAKMRMQVGRIDSQYGQGTPHPGIVTTHVHYNEPNPFHKDFVRTDFHAGLDGFKTREEALKVARPGWVTIKTGTPADTVLVGVPHAGVG
jgi:hypothetical protein